MLHRTRTLTAGWLAALLVLGLAAAGLAQKSKDPVIEVAPPPRLAGDRNVPAAPQADVPQPPAPVVPDLVATYLGPVAKDQFAFRWKEKGGNFTRAVCRMGWEVPATQLSTSGLDRNFGTYCAEALVGVVAGRTYRFEFQVPEVPEMYGLPDTVEGRAQADRRAKYLRELYGRFYLGSIREEDPDAARAFQAAIWEILHESELPEQPAAPFSLFGGNFQADYPALDQAPPFVQRAEGYLQALTGQDNVFWQNLPGRELVRLKWLANEDGEAAAQSQLALRYTRGGAAGYNGATAAPVGAPTGFAPVGAAGGFGAPGVGGFPFGGGSGSGGGTIVPTGSSSGGLPPNSISTPPTSPPVIVPPTVPPISSTSTSSTSSTGGVIVNPPEQPPVLQPVPAPPGVLLAGILFGAYAGRRILARMRPAPGGEPAAA